MVMIGRTTVAFLLLGGASPLLIWRVDRNKQSRSRRLRRNLLPSLPHLGPHPGPHGRPHPGHASGKYTGCLGLTTDELEEASRFKEDMPKCEIVVDGTTVVSNTLSSSASAESDSSNIFDVATTTTSTVTNVYEDKNADESGASGGSDDNVEDQDDEVNVDDNYQGDQSSASGCGENNEDDAINIEDQDDEVNVDDNYQGDQSSASGGEENNEDDAIDIEDQDDEVNVDDDYQGDQSSASGGEENNEDDAINNIEDSGSTSESVASNENDNEIEAASDETFTDDQASGSSTTVDENSDIAAEEVDESPNPLHLFDMKECSSFSALWMWDLALTCSNSTSLESCSCTAAKILIQYGEIDCENDECPTDCSVCDMCMKLSGCGPTKELQRGAAIEEDMAEAVPVAFIGLTAAMFGVQLVLFKMYWSRRSQPGGALGSNLMD